MADWHIITSEYPPQPGGVSGYTYHLARGLAGSGMEVHVWCPPASGSEGESPGVTVHRTLGNVGIGDLRRLGRDLMRFPEPRRLLVQWVPHGFGFHSMNLPFCLWLWSRSVRSRDQVEIMVHEPFLAFGEGSWRQNIAAVIHRLMTVILLRSADHVWVSIPEWEKRWRPYALGRSIPFQWLPIPSTIAVENDEASVCGIRKRYAAADTVLIGHLGTYGSAVTTLLESILLACERGLSPKAILLMGVGSEVFREKLVRRHSRLGASVQAAGSLSPRDLSCHVAACDFMIQPYPDGVSTRRTSSMVGLSHGKPIVTTSGRLSEPFWAESDAVLLAPAGDAELFSRYVKELSDDPARRALIGRAAGALYEERFEISHTVSAFLQTTLRATGCLV